MQTTLPKVGSAGTRSVSEFYISQIVPFVKNKDLLRYAGVKITNVYDDGGKGNARQNAPATIYAFFKPQTQVKSADPVTYDDGGNVIPLSERFKESEVDIRYSRKESLTNINIKGYNIDRKSPLSLENRAQKSSINWVYKSEIFSVEENILFHSIISKINQGSKALKKTWTENICCLLETRLFSQTEIMILHILIELLK